MLIDAHTHIGFEDLETGYPEYIRENKILSLACGTYPDSAELLERLAKSNPYILPVYGLHPWCSAQYRVSEMEAWIKSATILGEIGMDSVWCDVPLEIQQEAFVEQLKLAEKLKLPIVLHTKGQELTIKNILIDYTTPKMVHWYSESQWLEDYIDLDCYFTVGPDFDSNHAVQELVKKVNLNRLLVETDGLSAIEWLTGKKTKLSEIEQVLKKTVTYIAEVKSVSIEYVEQAIEQNLKSFIQRNT